jgi:hypothetical protein
MKYLLCLAVLIISSTNIAEAAGPRHVTPPVGYTITKLPPNHSVVKVNRRTYYVQGGFYYEKKGKRFAVVRAPVGARLTALPSGYVWFSIGPAAYFYFSGTYYMRDQDQYVVVDPPPDADQYVASADQQMIVYPASGQSEEQTDQDRYECYRWAMSATGFDPVSDQSDYALKPDYDRAMSACLEGRGYIVK